MFVRAFLFILLFSCKSFAAPSYEIETIKPIPIPGEYIRKRQREKRKIPDRAGYKGDFSKEFYKKENNTNHFYTALNISLPASVTAEDAKSTKVEYPGAGGETIDLNSTGEFELGGSVGFGVALGYEKKYSAYELEFSYNSFDVDKIMATHETPIDPDGDLTTEEGFIITNPADSTLSIAGISLNYLLSLQNNNKNLVPYIGAGYGIAIPKVTDFGEMGNFYQLQAGIKYRLNDTMQFFLGYKNLNYTDLEYQMESVSTNASNIAYSNPTYTLKHSLNSHSILVGYKFNFTKKNSRRKQ
jgi:hypothetical protein